MPATYTHHLFTKDVFKSLDKKLQNKIDVDTFNLFGKSFDALFFYKTKLGSYMHTNFANLYFANTIKYIREHNLINEKAILSYLYGSICHYVLDSTIHPFVYYYGGKYDKNNKKTYKYRGKHDYIESMIDAILYKERNNKIMYKNRVYAEVFPKYKFSNELFNTINYVYLNTFNVNNGGKIYFKSYKHFKFCYKYFMSSRFGFKKFVLKVFDKLHLVKSLKLQYLNYRVTKFDKSVLNLEHNKWFYPVDKKINYHYSFYDLYDVALVKATKLIKLIDDALDKDDKTIKKVLKEIGNLGYGTGVNENRKVVMKYFAN